MSIELRYESETIFKHHGWLIVVTVSRAGDLITIEARFQRASSDATLDIDATLIVSDRIIALWKSYDLITTHLCTFQGRRDDKTGHLQFS